MMDSERPRREGAREVRVSDVIELYQDPETETKSAGFAFVWAILNEDDAFYELQVYFLSDPAAPGRKFTRKYRKYPANRESLTPEKTIKKKE